MSHPTHIFLAEDNPVDVMLVELALKEHGINCTLVVMNDGADAARFFRDLDGDSETEAPDLILLDLHLPKQDGDEILRQVRASERFAKTPIVVMSSSDSPQGRAGAKRYSARFFRKPLDLDAYMELGTIVKQELAEQSPANLKDT